MIWGSTLVPQWHLVVVLVCLLVVPIAVGVFVWAIARGPFDEVGDLASVMMRLCVVIVGVLAVSVAAEQMSTGDLLRTRLLPGGATTWRRQVAWTIGPAVLAASIGAVVGLVIAARGAVGPGKILSVVIVVALMLVVAGALSYALGAVVKSPIWLGSGAVMLLLLVALGDVIAAMDHGPVWYVAWRILPGRWAVDLMTGTGLPTAGCIAVIVVWAVAAVAVLELAMRWSLARIGVGSAQRAQQRLVLGRGY